MVTLDGGTFLRDGRLCHAGREGPLRLEFND